MFTAAVSIVLLLVFSYCIVALILYCSSALAGMVPDIASILLDPFSWASERADERRRRRQLWREIQMDLGLTEAEGTTKRREVVRAAQQMQVITVLDAKLRSAVSECNSTHFVLADAMRSQHMIEAAGHPEAQRRRRRNIDLAELLYEQLAAYPLFSGELMALRIGVEAIGPVCACCPYFSVRRVDAPRLCPPAAAMVPDGPSDTERPVVDAEIVGG